MKTFVILNPHAGTSLTKELLRVQLKHLPEHTIAPTRQPGDAMRLATKAVRDGYELVVAAGGDGTINEVLNGMSVEFGQAALGILPLGTANDFARTINVPQEISAAVDVLLSNRTERVDVIRFTGAETRYFLNAAAGGFSGMVSDALSDEIKQTWGSLAYLRTASIVLPKLTGYHTYISFDDEPVEKLDVYNLVVANARYVAGGIPIAPDAHLNDGLADVIIVPTASMIELAILGPQILMGTHLTSELILARRTRTISIRSEPGMWFNVDGELVGRQPARFDVLPRAIDVVVGPVVAEQ
jgi:diacylglycerol kinase (ATP)